MNNYKNNHRKNRFKSSNDRPYRKRNGNGHKINNEFNSNSDFKRRNPGRNNQNAAKLIDKYNDLAREALSNGDKILSENYLQHADHFTRILNERESFKRDKIFHNKSEMNTVNIDVSVENSEQNSEKDLSDKTSEDTEINKISKSLEEVN